jgi:non-homologous end joining protein Ku
MSKTMCRTKSPEKRAKKQVNPKFVCTKCGKKVSKEKYVCKPEKLQS